MPVDLRFTYDVTTPESAEHGDYAESGWYEPGGWRGQEAPEPTQYTAREALREIERAVGSPDHIQCDGGLLRVYPADSSTDSHTGAEERITAHVRGNPRLLRAMERAIRANWRR